MSPAESILGKLRELLPEVRRRFGVASLAIFGSVARNDAVDGSDVDILVSFAPGAKVTLFTLAALTRAIESRLGLAVDLIEDHPRLRPSFRREIERDLRRVA